MSDVSTGVADRGTRVSGSLGLGQSTLPRPLNSFIGKLALVASGRAPGSLLDTYGAERAPVAARVLGLTHTLVRYGTMTSALKRMLRDTVIPQQRRSARFTAALSASGHR
jgi:2-polyprenyl-6-methoxyphenol hydroxylase-like FAD-dependent oxidoreductase